MGAGISLLTVWASAGTRINPSARAALGWVPGEQPANEYENYIQYTKDTKINEILAYLNAGISLDDLIQGDATLAGSSLEFIGGGDGVVTLDDGGLMVEDDDSLTEIRPKGLRFAPLVACDIRDVVPISVSLTGATWTSADPYDGTWSLDQDIEIPDLEFLSDSGVYMGLTVTGYQGSSIVNHPSHQYSFQSITGGSELKTLHVRTTDDPNSLTLPRLTFWAGITSESVPSGI